jgi:hypothetical protein
MRTSLPLLALAAGLALVVPAAAAADDVDDPIIITIKDHKFSPAEVKVPANKRLIVTVVNDDPTPEEFESKSLRVEKVIAGKSQGAVRIGPLKPGRYGFFGEFHEATAQGAVIAE